MIEPLLIQAQTQPESLTLEQWTTLMALRGLDAEKLYQAAYAIKVKNVGKKVYLRGLIEYSNQCSKNCYYCGIRRDNHRVKRYELSDIEVLNAAQWADEHHLGSIVIQAGERSNPTYVARIESLIRAIKTQSDGALGITLSLGEQTYENLERWFNAGAHRALIRIETSDPVRYHTLHPNDALHAYTRRLDALHDLRRIGYQVGSGVLIGLPEQTDRDRVKELFFLHEWDVDMIGMGPFIAHEHTPMRMFTFPEDEQLYKGLNMIACARLMMPNINIASTTALQTLHPLGREKGIQAGANIIMPNITPVRYREAYQLYQGKPAYDEHDYDAMSALAESLHAIGEEIGYSCWGDSPKALSRSCGTH